MVDQIDKKAVKELLPFLSLNARGDVKSLALDYILGLSGSDSGKHFLNQNEEYLRCILELTRDLNSNISRDAYSTIVNLSAELAISDKLLKFNIIEPFLSYALKQTSEHADKVAMILSNVTRTETGCREVLKVTNTSEECSLYKIVEVLCVEKYNPRAELNYLATFLSNLTQLQESRDYILDRDCCVIQRLLPFTTYSASLVKRRGIVAVLKNCCFESRSHQWLLSDAVDILPHLLLPLTGPEEFPEDEMEKLPPDLQYMDDNKERESDPDIRNMLLEALLQLCSTKHGREMMRKFNIYVILKELFNWEVNEEVKKSCGNVIQVLIADEPEPSMQDLKQVQIPEEVRKKFDEEPQKKIQNS